jgi:phosphate transport system substrate-binding protein
MTMAQVDAVFSGTRTCGYANDITKWSDLGVTGSLGNQTIELYGRNSVSGTYGYFKEEALCKGDFKNTVKEQPGSASVVQGVSESLNAIGYSGIGYKTASVKTVPLAKKEGDEFYDATPDNAISGKFPLSRFLYVYVNKAPNKPLEPNVAEFMKMVLAKQGQEVVLKDGYVPLPAKVADKFRAELGL